MTLEELARAWNELRAAVIGRDGSYRVSAALAALVGTEYDRWRAYYTDVGPQADFAPTVVAAEWIDRYRQLAQAVASERTDFSPSIPVTAPTPIETLATVGRALGWVLATLGLALVGLAVARAVSK